MSRLPILLVHELHRLAILPLVICWLFAGCGSPAPQLKPVEVNHLDKILQAIRTCVEQKKQPPKNQEELLPFLEKLGNPQELLVSPRDGQPYTIVWGTNPFDFSANDPSQPLGPILAYEQQGAAGVRFIATAHGVLSVDEKEFEKLRGVGKKP